MTARERGFLLLTGTLGDPERDPLTVAQFRTLASRMAQAQRPLEGERELNCEDLLSLGYNRTMAGRIVALLAQEDLLDHYLLRAKKLGCVPITRVSELYPVILRKRLGLDAPACLWARGDLTLLDSVCIALVGSRDLLPENRHFAEEAGTQAARQGFTLVSGNARGADTQAQNAALKAGGKVISVVADELCRHEPQPGILYLSEEGFDLPFAAQRAISRNRVIHALGWRTLVAQVRYGHGGTWDGSTKNLRNRWSPLFCFEDGSEGCRALLNMGANTVNLAQLADFSLLQDENCTFFDQ